MEKINESQKDTSSFDLDEQTRSRFLGPVLPMRGGKTPRKGMRAFADVDGKLYYVKKENSGNRSGCGCGCVGMDTLLRTSVCWVAE